MIPHGVEIFMALQPIDLRWGFDRLAGLVGDALGRDEPAAIGDALDPGARSSGPPANPPGSRRAAPDPRSGALFVFFGKRRDCLKVLFFDGTGMCQFYTQLDAISRPRRGLPERRASLSTRTATSLAASRPASLAALGVNSLAASTPNT